MIINARRSCRPSSLHIAPRARATFRSLPPSRQARAYRSLCTNCHRSSRLYANCLSVLIGSAAECVNYPTDGQPFLRVPRGRLRSDPPLFRSDRRRSRPKLVPRYSANRDARPLSLEREERERAGESEINISGFTYRRYTVARSCSSRLIRLEANQAPFRDVSSPFVSLSLSLSFSLSVRSAA